MPQRSTTRNGAIARATHSLIVSFMQFLQPNLQEAISKARAGSARKAQTTQTVYKDHTAIYEAIVASAVVLFAIQYAGNAVLCFPRRAWLVLRYDRQRQGGLVRVPHLRDQTRRA
jgi:hypothetical protein